MRRITIPANVSATAHRELMDSNRIHYEYDFATCGAH